MPMTDAQRREAAAALVEAERTRSWIEPITLTYPGADIEDAYAIGQYVTEAKVKAGRVVKDHKVGLTSKAMRSTTGATEPDFGTIFDNWFVDEGTQVSLSALNRPKAEIELVFVLKSRLGGPSVNAVDVIRATDFPSRRRGRRRRIVGLHRVGTWCSLDRSFVPTRCCRAAPLSPTLGRSARSALGS